MKGTCPIGENDPERHGACGERSKIFIHARSNMVLFPDSRPDKWVPNEPEIILKIIKVNRSEWRM